MTKPLSELATFLSSLKEEEKAEHALRCPAREPDYTERKNLHPRMFWWDEFVFSFWGFTVGHPLYLIEGRLKWSDGSRYAFPDDVQAAYKSWLDEKFEKEVLDD